MVHLVGFTIEKNYVVSCIKHKAPRYVVFSSPLHRRKILKFNVISKLVDNECAVPSDRNILVT